jgi:glycosyltransferase involved in cell wall biosynthesis
MEQPFVSVIMAVCNGAATLQRGIKSLQNQTFPGWELLCVDDCSTDDSYELLLVWSKRDDRRWPRLLAGRGGGAAGGCRARPGFRLASLSGWPLAPCDTF